MLTHPYKTPGKSADCPDGMTLNVVQKLGGKDLQQAQVCTLGLLLI